jgi:hypothetical protein
MITKSFRKIKLLLLSLLFLLPHLNSSSFDYKVFYQKPFNQNHIVIQSLDELEQTKNPDDPHAKDLWYENFYSIYLTPQNEPLITEFFQDINQLKERHTNSIFLFYLNDPHALKHFYENDTFFKQGIGNNNTLKEMLTKTLNIFIQETEITNGQPFSQFVFLYNQIINFGYTPYNWEIHDLQLIPIEDQRSSEKLNWSREDTLIALLISPLELHITSVVNFYLSLKIVNQLQEIKSKDLLNKLKLEEDEDLNKLKFEKEQAEKDQKIKDLEKEQVTTDSLQEIKIKEIENQLKIAIANRKLEIREKIDKQEIFLSRARDRISNNLNQQSIKNRLLLFKIALLAGAGIAFLYAFYKFYTSYK